MLDGRQPRVIVTDAGRGSAVAIIRSLGRRGWYVIAADADRPSPGFHSRFAGATFRYPSPAVHPDAVPRALLRAALEHQADLIMPVTDEVILPLAANRALFPASCTLAIPRDELLRVTSDKQETLELARRVGVPTPPSSMVSTTKAAVRRAREIGWPVVLKPRSSRIYRQGGRDLDFLSVTYANNEEQLKERMRQYEGRCEVLLQGFCEGEAHGVELLLQDGRPLVAFQHRRLREVPVTGGASSFRESVPLDPTLHDYALRLLGSIGWTGLAMVEFKVGRDGPRLMEINGRVWGSLPLAVRAGVDFPGLAAELYLFGGLRSAAPRSYRIGVRSRNLELDTVWIASVLRGKRRHPYLPWPRRGEALRAILSMLDRDQALDLFSRDDPAPGLAEVAKIVGDMRRKLRAA